MKAKTRRSGGWKLSATRRTLRGKSRSISPSRPIFPNSPANRGRARPGRDRSRVHAARRPLAAIAGPRARRNETILWALTDGVRFYRGSSVSALARLKALPVSASVDRGAFGPRQVRQPRARLSRRPRHPADAADGGRERDRRAGALAKRPGAAIRQAQSLGAKIGIFADSLCPGFAEARTREAHPGHRYRDRALIQPFIEGDDVRVSFVELGGDLADQLGVERIIKNPASDTGGAYPQR